MKAEKMKPKAIKICLLHNITPFYSKYHKTNQGVLIPIITGIILKEILF